MGMKLFIGSLMVMAVMATGFAWYFKNTQARITTLVGNQAKLEGVIQTQNETMKTMKENLTKQLNLSKDLNAKLNEADKQNKQIAGLLAKTDIVKNSMADPKRVEGSINEKAKKLFDTIKSITTRSSTK
tara:strand:- start:448 stop:834 length:387 start_codon:yes stop_codon:yes gene_type:complete